MKFLVELTQNETRPLTMTRVMSTYKAKQNRCVTPRALRRYFRRRIAPRMHEMEEYDEETRVKLIYATSTAINPSFLTKLRLHATVEVDGEQRITKYSSATLQLEGKHRPIIVTPSDNLNFDRGMTSSSSSDFRFKSIKTEVDEEDSTVDKVERKSMKMDLDLYSPASSGGLPTPNDSFLEMMAQSSQNSMDAGDAGIQNLWNPMTGLMVLPPRNPSEIQSPQALQMALPESPSLPSISFPEDSFGAAAAERHFVNSIGNFMNAMNGMIGAMAESMMNRNNTHAPSAPEFPSSTEASYSIDTHTITTKKQFLSHIQMCLLSIGNPLLTEFYHRVVGELEKCENEPVAMSKLRLALQTIVTISMAIGFGSRDEGALSPPQTTNAKKFLELLELFISAQEAPELKMTHEQLKATIDSTDDAKEIEVKVVQMAFETALITMGI
ncbi:unnamed protein product [Caenorhabditis brenneri]